MDANASMIKEQRPAESEKGKRGQISEPNSETRLVYKLFKLRLFIKPTLIVFGIYCIAQLSVWRANFSYGDDFKRIITGTLPGHEFNRYTAEFFLKALNMNAFLTDISPYSQMLAMFFMSIASVIMTYVFCNRTIKYIPLIMSLFIGLSPFMLGCWTYKFDAPLMAMSMLVCIIPFLFWDSHFMQSGRKQVVKSMLLIVICLMFMWTSYQISNGIFLIILLGMIFNDYLRRRQAKQTIKKTAIFATSFLISAILFKFALPSYDGYRDTEMFAIKDLILGVLQNITKQFLAFNSTLNTEWKALLLLVFVAFLLSLFTFSERKGIFRLIDSILGALFPLIAFSISFGVFIVLQTLSDNGRAFVGVGVVLAITSILTVSRIEMNWKMSFAIPSAALIYSFLVFTLAFGNGLADQERYGNFRVESLLNDLSHIYTTEQQVDETVLQIQGGIGDSAVLKLVRAQYPIVNKIIYTGHKGLGQEFGYYKLTYFYNRPQEYLPTSKTTAFDCDSMKTDIDTYYHTIKSNDKGEVCVIIK
jgi:hypothetical protein